VQRVRPQPRQQHLALLRIQELASGRPTQVSESAGGYKPQSDLAADGGRRLPLASTLHIESPVEAKVDVQELPRTTAAEGDEQMLAVRVGRQKP
jgi:hypothetical protein